MAYLSEKPSLKNILVDPIIKLYGLLKGNHTKSEIDSFLAGAMITTAIMYLLFKLSLL